MMRPPFRLFGLYARALGALALCALAPALARAGFTATDSLGPGDVGKELANNTVYKVESDLTLTNTGTGPGLSVASGATVVLYIKKGVTLTVTGGNSSGRSAGDAGLRVLSGRTLVVTGGGKLVAIGGNAGNGVNGGDAGACSLDMSGNSHGGHGGAGGNGGAGASAGIGGYGGTGGTGGSRPADESWVETNDSSDYDRDGHNGNSGDAGGNGADMGTLYLLGSVNVTATGGSGGSGGSPGGNTGGEHDSNWSGVNWYYVGGAGGGGGGAGGIAPYYAIGGGGGGGGGGGSGGNGGLYWKGSGGTGTANKPDGAGGQGGWDNGVSSSRTEPDYAQSSSGTKYKHGGYRGSGGAKGANGGNGTLYRDSGVTLNATCASATSATTHSAIEYLLVFDDAQRVYEAMDVKLGYAYPTAPIPPLRPGWTFNGWFTEKNGGGTKYYNADGTATAVEWATCSDVTLYASWTLTDPDAAASIWINGTPLVGGTSTSGYGWDYNGADGRLTLTASTGSYVITGKDETGEFSIYAAANLCTVVMSNLTMNASSTIARPPFESVPGKIAALQFEGVNKLTGCSGYPAVYVAEGSSVTIGGAGQVEAIGGANAPGIGGRTGETRGTAKLNITGGTIVANGGANGSGIGAAKSAGFGITTISGGTITATGKEGAAGIGGSQGAGMGTYIISGGAVTAKGGTGGPGIGSGRNAIGGTVKITGGSVTATSGYYAAAIGCGQYGSSFNVEISGGEIMATGDSGRYSGAGIGGSAATTNLTISVSGGTITARGGKGGAGIGGGHKSKDVSISVTGGNITAVGGNYGAGIGAGDGDIGDNQNATISISGGLIEADGGINAAGIGSGDYASCGAITISGGTVNVTADTGAKKIGNGRAGYGKASSVTITGGAVYPALAQVSPAPTNSASKAVFPVDFEIGEATNKVTSLTLSGALSGYSYGVNDAYTDANGNLRVWLPATSGVAFMAKVVMASGNTYYFSFDIDNKGNVSVRGHLVVNDGVVASNVDNSGRGWSFAKDTGVVTISADAVVQGFSTNGEYRIVVPSTSSASAMTLRKLTLVGPVKKDAPALKLSRDVTLTLSGENALTGDGQYSAGIEVASTATLTVKGDGTLSATGGQNAAGIGSAGGFTAPGKIVIAGGVVVAQGGTKAAGIGGGVSSVPVADGIVISGGHVTATGGASAAGIGSGYATAALPAGAVRITGGTVLSTKGASGSSDLIHSGNSIAVSGADRALVVTGGSVHGANLSASPAPVDAAGAQLRYWLFEGLEPGATPVFGEGLPAGYGLSGVVADATGSVCLWLPSTNATRSVILGGKYFSGGGATNNVFSIESGSDEPPDSIREDGRTKWRVTVPALLVGEETAILGLEAAGVSSAIPGPDGRAFLYLPDGDYAFSAGGFDYAAAVAGAAVDAELLRVGVAVNGVDAAALGGEGWAFLPGEHVLALTNAGPFAISGAATNVGIRAEADCAATLGGLALTNGAARLVPFECGGRAVALSLAGTNVLVCAVDGLPGIRAAGASALVLSEAAEGASLGVLGGRYAAAIGGGAGEAAGAVAIEGGAVTAQGGYYGAGIGGGNEASGGTIAIRGGTVAATGGQNGAGIGGGRTYDTPGGADGGDVTIEGGTVTATAGFAAAGIGGGLGGPGGRIRILGGSVRAIGHNLSAGIGGSCAPGGTIEISGGTVRASSSSGAGIGGGDDSAGGTITISGGEVTASSGAYGAGIGGGDGGDGGTIAISGGVVKAGASDGAGIGGGRDGAGGTIGISGGAVEAIAQKGAGIGGGHGAAAGTIEISGGIVAATCFDDSAAIGGGCNGTGGTVAISGGTVTATGYNSDFHVGSGNGGSVQSVAFSGGSIHTTPARVSPAATNLLAKAVHPVDFLVGAANVRIETFSIDTPPLDYGANDLYTDENGILRAWLPDGRWLLDLKAEGGETERWLAVVNGENALAARYAPGSVGFFVNGTDVGEVVGEGWTFDTVRGGLTLSGDGPFELSGTLTNATVAIAANCAVTLSNAVVDASAVTNAGAIHLASGVTATLTLVGENAATGGVGRAGVTVPAGATLTIDKSNLSTLQPFNLATLAAAGGEGAAGIGGDSGAAAGTIRIAGGVVSATGGASGAGIGGGSYAGEQSCRIEISGGFVTATAGEGAYDIGAGVRDGAFSSDFGHVAISGGTVRPVHSSALGIGSGADKATSNFNSFRISGGAIFTDRGAVSPVAWSVGVQSLAYPVDFDLGEPDAPVNASIPLASGDSAVGYGLQDVRTDARGVARLWLPEGNRLVTVDGVLWRVSVSPNGSSAGPWHANLTVNGAGIESLSGEGWNLDVATMVVHLTGAGPFELSGEEEGAAVSVETSCAVVLKGVTLATGETGPAALDFRDDVTATLELVGTNSLASGKDHPGLGIAETASLAIRGEGGLSAFGGYNGAGIGGGGGSAGHCGALSIEGGVIVAQGGWSGAGIGGASGSSCGTIAISGGDVTALGGLNAPGIGQKENLQARPGSILVSGGVVTATGGEYGAGIGGGLSPYYYHATPVVISGGVVAATGGEGGAGIGGSAFAMADVTISGGVVTATGGYHGAGIGGGEGSYGMTYSAGTVRISGGIVSATAGVGAHGIGGGYLSDRGSVEITGGTVAAAGGEGGMDVGIVGPSGVAGSVVFGGGSILADMAKVKPAAKNASGEAVWRVDVAVPDPDPARAVAVTGLDGYGVADIYPDANGDIHLWLPDGTYDFEVDGTPVHEEVDGSSVFIPLGVAVDGVDVGLGSGPNWVLDDQRRIVLSGACVVSGTNTLDGLSIRFETSDEIVFSNACIRSQQGFAVATNVSAVVRGIGRNVVAPTYWPRLLEEGASFTVAGGTFMFRSEEAFTILGGSVSGLNTYYARPENADGASLWCADVPGFAPGAAVGPLQGLPDYYDTTELFADDDGALHLWLPEGLYVATNAVDGAKWTIRIGPEGEATVVAWNDDFTVNGVNIAALSGDGWNYANGVLTLAGIEHYTLHGTNVVGGVRVLVAADATVELSGVSVRSERPFALGDGVAATVLLSGPGNALVSTYSSNAGLFVPHSASLTITNATDDARLYACGGRYGAGIGANSGQSDRPGDITIAGGIVEARPSETNEGYAAGIGAGFAGYSGRIRITGGRVYAYGSQNGSGASAGIGGSAEPYDDSNGLIEISGGTVYACGGSASAERIGADIGDGTSQRDVHDNRNAVVITGGNVVLAHFGSEKGGFTQSRTDEENLPHDAAGNVLHAVVVPLGTPDAAVAGLVLPASAGSYGTRDLYADANGDLYLWLPDGDYAFTVDGARWTATVDGADTVAVRVLDPVDPLGVFVDGVDVCALAGDGWTYDPATSNLVLSAAGPYTLSGTNTAGEVQVVVAADAAVTVSNLRIAATDDDQCAFALADGVAARLTLVGANSLASGEGRPGILCPAGRTLAIAGDGALTAIGGDYGAGIGGGDGESGGTIAIDGGLVTALGGYGGAGIGGGNCGAAGAIAISGGTVAAQGGGLAADIGEGALTSGGETTIAGGSVHALVGNAMPAPSNGVERVWCVTVTNLAPNAAVAGLLGLPASYGTAGLVADADGKIYLWLPDGDYAFTADGADYTATVDGANTVAELVPPVIEPLGVLVDGVDICALAGDGWTYDPATSNLVLSAAGPYILSGTNTAGQVQVVGRPASGNPQSIVLSNLVLSAAAPLVLETNSSPLLTVLGENSLSATAAGRPAILVPAGASLLVAGGDAVRDSLSATGGEGSPAVSGAGTLGLVGGRLFFAGGAGAASLAPGSLVAFGGTTVAPSVSAATSALLAGGSFRAASADVSPAPSNATERVFCVTVTNLVPNAAVEDLSGLPDGYGVDGIVADGDGRIYLWLPDGMNVFVVDGAYYRAVVDGADTVAELVEDFDLVGVSVNGVDIGFFAGDGWTYDPTTSHLVLSGGGPYAISGTNTAGEVTILCRALAGGAEQSVVLADLVLSSSAASPFALEAGAAVALSLAGTNELTSSKSGQPALLVPGGASLTVTNAPSEPTNGGTLSAVATADAPGIGGLAYGAVGDIAIAGGRVVARGNGYAVAGIGAGNGGTGGSVSISGGLVDARGGTPGAGLGGGGSGNGPSVSISGGTVFAQGHNTADVGPSAGKVTSASPQAVLLTGGSLRIANRCEPPASNGVERVWCVTVTNLPPAALVEGLQGLPAGYGANDLYADADGKLYLWLPAGDYELRIAPDDLWTATVADKNVVATYRSVAKPDSIVIDSIAVAEDAVTLVVTVAPAVWLEAHAGDLRVRASDTLPVSAGELLDPAAVAIAADPATGEATLVLPSPAPPSRFYRVEIP